MSSKGTDIEPSVEATKVTGAQMEDVASNITAPENLQDTLNSDEYQRAMFETYAVRARVGVVGRFLVDTVPGRFITQMGLVPHPILKQKEKQEGRIKKMSEQIRDTSQGRSITDIELEVRNFPEFQPKSDEAIVLEAMIDRMARLRAMRKPFYDRNRDVDYRFDFNFDNLQQLFAGAESLPQLRVYFDEELGNRKLSFLRRRFYDCLSGRDWTGLFDLISGVSCSQEFTEVLSSWIFDHRHSIFLNPHFRRLLFRHLMTTLLEHGVQKFEKTGDYWHELGVDFSDPEEKKTLAKEAFPTPEWYLLMNSNPGKYFELQKMLADYGIYP